MLSDQGQADLAFEAGDLQMDRGLRSAVLMSLFCDARAREDEVAAGDDPRGWWAEDPGDPWGSRLWLLSRAKRTGETLQLARDYVVSALRWLERNGCAERVDVAAFYGPRGELALNVSVIRGRARRWEHLWAGEQAHSDVVGGVQLTIIAG